MRTGGSVAAADAKCVHGFPGMHTVETFGKADQAGVAQDREVAGSGGKSAPRGTGKIAGTDRTIGQSMNDRHARRMTERFEDFGLAANG